MSGSQRSRLMQRAALAVLVGLALQWALVILGEGGPPPAGGGLGRVDLEMYFVPKFVFGSEEIAAGRLPLWNRFEYGGIPFLATALPTERRCPPAT